MKRLIGYLFIFLHCIMLHAQNEIAREKKIKEILDRLIENQSLVLDQSDLELNLKEWLSDPILLNKAGTEELNKLVFLNPAEVQAILEHRKQYGPFLSKYELQSVSGLDLNTAEILSFLTIIEEKKQSDNMSVFKMVAAGKHEIILQDGKVLEKTKEFQEPQKYAGTADHISVRYRFNYQNKLYFGFSMEKDPGEKWNHNGDFQSFHFLYKGKGMVQTIALGDFQANFGKGLNLGTSMFNGKSSLIFQSQYYGEGFKPYRSLNENGFMRGLGISLRKHNLNLDFWVSMAPVSASLQYDSLLQEDKIAGIALGGLHRTNTELSRRNNAFDQTAGFNLKYNFRKLQLGLILNKNERCAASDFLKNNNLKNWSQFNQNCNTGFYVNYFLRNNSLSGELSENTDGKRGYLLNGIFPLHSKVDLTLTYRNYGTGFENKYSNAWSAQSSIGNEQGVYVALAFKPKNNMQLNIFSDFYKSAGPKYLTAFPSKGRDYFIDYLYNISKSFQIECRYRNQQNQKNLPLDLSPIKILSEDQRTQYRIQLNYMVNSNWSYRFRAEKVIAKKTDGSARYGNMIYHEVSCHPKLKKWSLHGRICLFQIEDYSARVYVLENDVRYNYSQSQLNGNGTRIFLNCSYKISKNFELNLRIAQTFLPEAEAIETSYDTISGMRQTECKVQLRWFTGK